LSVACPKRNEVASQRRSDYGPAVSQENAVIFLVATPIVLFVAALLAPDLIRIIRRRTRK